MGFWKGVKLDMSVHFATFLESTFLFVFHVPKWFKSTWNNCIIISVTLGNCLNMPNRSQNACTSFISLEYCETRQNVCPFKKNVLYQSKVYHNLLRGRCYFTGSRTSCFPSKMTHWMMISPCSLCPSFTSHLLGYSAYIYASLTQVIFNSPKWNLMTSTPAMF